MANYKLEHAETGTYNTPDLAANALEALLEALDSTTNPLRVIKIVPVGDMWKGIILYDIP